MFGTKALAERAIVCTRLASGAIAAVAERVKEAGMEIARIWNAIREQDERITELEQRLSLAEDVIELLKDPEDKDLVDRETLRDLGRALDPDLTDGEFEELLEETHTELSDQLGEQTVALRRSLLRPRGGEEDV